MLENITTTTRSGSRSTSFQSCANPDLSIGLADGKVLFITPESVVVMCFTLMYPTLCTSLRDVRLGCSCSDMETMKFSTHFS